MKASEIRAIAREKLTGKWGKAALATLVYGLITGVISSVLDMFEEESLLSAIMSIVSVIITVPMTYGFLVTMFKLNDDEEISYIGFLTDGFSNFKKIWSITLQSALKVIIPIILFIVSLVLFFFSTATTVTGGPGFLAVLGVILYIAALIYLIYKALQYSLVLFIFKDNPDMDSKEIVEKSAELMDGKIGAYIGLQLSFIGWAFLAAFTFGIGFLWLMPYMQVSQINFYRNLVNETPAEDSHETEETLN